LQPCRQRQGGKKKRLQADKRTETSVPPAAATKKEH
jgi:hypothetical protein